MMNIVIISGMPCSGKSTIAKEFCIKHGFRYISSGDIAREMADRDENIRRSLALGYFAPEGEMRKSIRNSVLTCINHDISFVIDGFPRFEEQDNFLNNIIETYSDIHAKYVLVDVDKQVCINRSLHRCREDDKSIIDRIEYFSSVTYPVVMSHNPIIIDNSPDKTLDGIVNDMYIKINQREEVINVTNNSKV